MKLSLALLAATLGFVAADELKIEVTHAVECERKSQSGDAIEVHYHGSLASNGEKFDASTEAPSPRPSLGHTSLTPSEGQIGFGA